ncbi:uncharacterized protein [Polyergus mexicanus]|uniref:uncharacterized protein n=1 Tax=Polyergus mexicanus TaxID=615972 RepID=UPI0038B5990D
MTGVTRGQINLEISACSGGSPMIVSALVLPRLTLYSGDSRAEAGTWKHLDGLKLADSETSTQYARTFQCYGENDLVNLVQRFWRQEEVSSGAAPLSLDERQTEDHYSKTHCRDANGRYVVWLPLKGPLPDLTETRRFAARLLGQMEKRVTRDSYFGQLYRDFMWEYEVLGHMSPAPQSPSEGGLVCFLLHHEMLRAASSSTKLRVVFNGSPIVASEECLSKR